jgi:hypothetical protein
MASLFLAAIARLCLLISQIPSLSIHVHLLSYYIHEAT